MTLITIPKKMTKGEELVVISKKEYERFLSSKKARMHDPDLRAALDDLKAGRVHGPFRNTKEGIRFLRRR